MARLKGGMGVAPSAAWGQNLFMSRAWGDRVSPLAAKQLRKSKHVTR